MHTGALKAHVFRSTLWIVTMTVNFRRATPEDNYTTFAIFRRSLTDYGERTGVIAITGGSNPRIMNKLWERRRKLWEHLTNSSDQYWLAEDENGAAVGYARSIRRGSHRELTEFFVLPDRQSSGVGKGLIERAFPHDTPQRTIIATSDYRAMGLYLKAGVYPYQSELHFERKPEPVHLETDLVFEASSSSKATLQFLAKIDQKILGFERDVDHTFLARDRSLYLYRRGGSVVGYGYCNRDFYGPFALLEKRDFPAVLAHAETLAYEFGANSIDLEVPAYNTIAVDYLIGRGYLIDGFMASIMSNRSFGNFENYILTSPPFFL